MKLIHLTVEKVKSIDFLDIEVADVNVLMGDNGVGKSSVIDAVADIFEGGHDPGLIQHGEEFCQTTLTVQDPAGKTYSVSKKHTPTSYTLDVRTGDGAKISRAKEFVEGLAKGFAIDPLSILAADSRERAKYFLKVLDLAFSAEEVNKAMTVLGKPPCTAHSKALSLEDLEKLLKGQEEERTNVNRRVRDLEGNQRSLKDTLPKEADETDWPAKLEQLQAAKSATASNRAAAEKQAELEISEASRKAEAEASEKLQAIRAESNSLVSKLNQQIKELEKQIQGILAQISAEDAKLESDVERVGASKAAAIAAIRSEKMAALSPIIEQYREQIASIDVEIGDAKARLQAVQQVEGVKKSIALLDSQMAPLQRRATELDRIIDALRKLRLAKLENLPIPGVQVMNGDLVVNGVPWEHVNTAQQIKIAIQAGALSFGSMPLMVTDKGEHLTPEAFEALMNELKAAGVQVIAARVGHKGEGLRVERAA